METLSCLKLPHGLQIGFHYSQEDLSSAYEVFVPACVVERSSLLRHLTADVAEGASFRLPAPKGHVQSWLYELRNINTENRLDVEQIGSGIMAADYLEDEELMQHLCGALGHAVGVKCNHYYTAGGSPNYSQTKDGLVPQVLQELSGPLVATVLRAAPVSLAQQLRLLPPSTNPHAMHAAFPDLFNTSSLDLDCSTLDATSSNLALTAVASVHVVPLKSLSIRGIATLATLQVPTVPAECFEAMRTACMGVMHVALDFREAADANLPGLVACMDPSATEGMLRGLGANTALESLEVKMWDCAPVAALLEGGGCTRQLNSLKLDIEGHSVEAALQAMAACTALTHLTLNVSITYCCVLAASLQCMTQLQELHLTLNMPKVGGHRRVSTARHMNMGMIRSVAYQVSTESEYSQLTTLQLCPDESNRYDSMMDPLLTAMRLPSFALNENLIQGMRVPGLKWLGKLMTWNHPFPRVRIPTDHNSVPENVQDDWPLLGKAIACLSQLTTLSLRGSWIQENEGTVARVLHDAPALHRFHLNLPDPTPGSSVQLKSIWSTLSCLSNLQQLSVCIKAPRGSGHNRLHWYCVPAEACSLLRSMQGLGLHSLCTSLQLSVRPETNDANIELWEHLKAFTCLRRLQLSRVDHACRNARQGPQILRMQPMQNSLVSLAAALTKLTYLKIGVSFAGPARIRTANFFAFNRKTRPKSRSCREAWGVLRQRHVGELTDTYLSGLICALKSLPMLQQLSLYSCTPHKDSILSSSWQNEFEVRALGEAMQGLTTLSKLSLNGLQLCRAPILSCVARLPALTELKLDGQFNVCPQLEPAMQGFSSLRQLKSLTVSRFGKSGALKHITQMLQALQAAGELMELHVGWVLGAGSSEAFKSFAQSLGGLRSLQSLSICSVRFVQHCAQFLAAALTHLRQLQRLSVDMCELIGLDVLALCGALQKLPEVVHVSFYGNRLSKQDLHRVEKRLQDFERLHSVQLGMQMPFVQCPCCDYFTLPRWSFNHGCKDAHVNKCIYLNHDEECFSRWICQVCSWDSSEWPGVENIESLLDKHSRRNRHTLRLARATFLESLAAGEAGKRVCCDVEECMRFGYLSREVWEN